jgi:ornithine--oxo-acid transaminase
MLRQAWNLMHKINRGLFAQAFTIPLLEKHAVLSQVARSNQDVLKIAPSFVVEQDDLDWLVRALDDVFAASHKFPGPFWEVATSLAKNALF